MNTRYVLIVLWLIFALGWAACKKNNLDSIAFPSERLESYRFEQYEGDTELELPDSFSVENNKINLISTYSYGPGENEKYKIYGVYIGDTSSIADDTIIVYCHGQAKHMDYYWSRAKLLAFTGGKYRYGVLMFDYRGYGMSEGESSEYGLYEDTRSFLRWLKNKGASPEKCIIYGFSLGTAPATEIAANFEEYKPAKLILESPMASVDNLAQESAIINISGKFLTTLELNNAEKIKRVNQPFMWLHGTEDDYIPISNGEIIYANYQGKYKEAHRVEGAKHGKNGVPETMGLAEYLETVSQFLVR